ncbi:hypothetical protein AAMO2058_000541400 [Amorphochlora amoebiformis]
MGSDRLGTHSPRHPGLKCFLWGTRVPTSATRASSFEFLQIHPPPFPGISPAPLALRPSPRRTQQNTFPPIPVEMEPAGVPHGRWASAKTGLWMQTAVISVLATCFVGLTHRLFLPSTPQPLSRVISRSVTTPLVTPSHQISHVTRHRRDGVSNKNPGIPVEYRGFGGRETTRDARRGVEIGLHIDPVPFFNLPANFSPPPPQKLIKSTQTEIRTPPDTRTRRDSSSRTRRDSSPRTRRDSSSRTRRHSSPRTRRDSSQPLETLSEGLSFSAENVRRDAVVRASLTPLPKPPVQRTGKVNMREALVRAHSRGTSMVAPGVSAKEERDIWVVEGQGCCGGPGKVWGGYLSSDIRHCRQLCIDTPPCQFASHGWSGMGSSWCDLFETCEGPALDNCRGNNFESVLTEQMLKREGIGRSVTDSEGRRTSGHGIIQFGEDALDLIGGNAYERTALFSTWALSTALAKDAFTQIHTLPDASNAVLAAGISILFADFFTGVFHWAVDNYGDENTPVFGAVIDAFQVHHDVPWTLTYRPLATNAFAISLSVLPVLVLATAAGPLSGGEGLSAPFELAVVVFTNLQVLSQEFHKFTHMKRVPPPIQTLQDCGIILPRKMHQNHHRSPFGDNYCIVTGQMNPLLDTTHFFRRLERLVYTCTGNEPKCWQLSPEMKEGVLKGEYRDPGSYSRSSNSDTSNRPHR